MASEGNSKKSKSTSLLGQQFRQWYLQPAFRCLPASSQIITPRLLSYHESSAVAQACPTSSYIQLTPLLLIYVLPCGFLSFFYSVCPTPHVSMASPVCLAPPLLLPLSLPRSPAYTSSAQLLAVQLFIIPFSEIYLYTVYKCSTTFPPFCLNKKERF